MNATYPLAVDNFGEEEIAAAKGVLDSGRLTMGERVARFETEFAAWIGADHAVMVNSGSSANLLMVDAMLRGTDRVAEWRQGDEVIVPALAWPTTVWPLMQLGLVPVFVDVDAETLAIDLESAAAALSSRTKGIFLISVLGQAPPMGRMVDFCEQHGLLLLEDSCESLGAHFAGRHVGTFGRMGSFSFYFSHHISTIEGGMIVCREPALMDDLRSLRAHGWVRDRSDRSHWKRRLPDFDQRFLFISAGYNVRPTEIQGAIGSVQLRRLDEMLDHREKLARKVHGWLGRSAPWLRLIGAERFPVGETARGERRARLHSWMTLPLLVDRGDISAETVKRRLEGLGVETRPIIAGNLVKHPAVERFSYRSAPSLARCDRLLTHGFMIGCHPRLAPGAEETLESAIRSLAEL